MQNVGLNRLEVTSNKGVEIKGWMNTTLHNIGDVPVYVLGILIPANGSMVLNDGQTILRHKLHLVFGSTGSTKKVVIVYNAPIKDNCNPR